MKSVAKLLTTSVATAIMIGAFVGLPSQRATASETTCSQVTILGARGSGESNLAGDIQGFGDSVSAGALSLSTAIWSIDRSITIKTVPVLYPAIAPGGDGISRLRFDNSVKEGVGITQSLISDELTNCPNTKIVMMGYSQGAEVMHEASMLLTAEEADSVLKVWLISDPTTDHRGKLDSPGGAGYFNETGYYFIPDAVGLITSMGEAKLGPLNGVGGPFPDSVKDKVIEVCHTDDQVCNVKDYILASEQDEAVINQILMIETPVNHIIHGSVYSGSRQIHDAPSYYAAQGIVNAVTGPSMKTKWNTEIAGCKTITLPISGYANGTIKVNWGDGFVQNFTTENPTHTYTTATQLANISVEGQFSNWGGDSTSWSPSCITEVSSWGETGTTDLSYAFSQASNLIKVAEIPSGVTNINGLFYNATSFNHSLNNWDTSKVTTMNGVFEGARAFNSPIDGWDTSHVTSMAGMFRFASKFNQPIATWSTSQVTDFTGMFQGANYFNQPIGTWDTSHATTMANMFYNAKTFNQPLANWDTSKVTSFSSMFISSSFNQPIGNWETSNSTSFSRMFYSAVYFNQDISGWKVTQGSTVDMFKNCYINPSFKPVM